MICEYAEEPYTAVCYDCTEKTGGGWDMSTWFSAKPALKEQNPLMNLPYVKDADGTVVAQTNACMRYLGTKLGLAGATRKEEVKVDELLCEAMDLRNTMCAAVYSGSTSGLEALLSHASLAKLEAVIAEGPYTLGAKPNVADFHIGELVDQLLAIKAFHSYKAGFEYPKLLALRSALWAEPTLASYFASALSKLPINNKMASFGATPSGADWVVGQSYDWGNTSNVVAMNAAYVFVKPHAVTDAVVGLAQGYFAGKGFKVTSCGTITAEEIDAKLLIDQHYYAIASKATILKPAQLNVPAEKFQAQFGISWSAALASGKVLNAMDACKEFGIDAAGLDNAWAVCKKAKKLVKFGGGFYCGLVELQGKALYVFNGFFMSMRSKFTEPGTCIKYFTIEWPASQCSWSDFRGKALGPTDPADAPADALRGIIANDWKALGLKAACDVGDNGVHASASPFEALAERANWLGASVETDIFGKLLIKAGLSLETIKAWSVDPVMKAPDGSKTSLFDFVEDTDVDECLARLMTLAACN
ncbi:nucleoside diphosphate kinase [Pelagophyceae sp. CCMP2097]|nr:nucleoside diphosphate kinase [Pelagophyceae sp. CCMP2097]